MENDRTLKVGVRFILLYFELAHTHLLCNMLQILIGPKKYEEEMSDKQTLLLKNSACVLK